jgi:hypothetical protein
MPEPIPLLEQSVWWVVPGVALSLSLVYAMMECTAALLTRAPRSRGEALDTASLRRQLLGLNTPGTNYTVTAHDGDVLVVHWDAVGDAWLARFGPEKLSSRYGARMLLDDARHEVRWYEWIRSGAFFVGFDGWRPRFSRSLSFQAGYLKVRTWTGLAFGLNRGWPPRIEQIDDFALDVGELRARIVAAVDHAGWSLRPTHIWFQTRPIPYRLVRALVPAWVRLQPPRRFWGIAYPASYVLVVGYLLWAAGAIRPQSAWLVSGITAAWWGVWGGLTWLLSRGDW